MVWRYRKSLGNLLEVFFFILVYFYYGKFLNLLKVKVLKDVKRLLWFEIREKVVMNGKCDGFGIFLLFYLFGEILWKFG